jgi:hypothetical protein
VASVSPRSHHGCRVAAKGHFEPQGPVETQRGALTRVVELRARDASFEADPIKDHSSRACGVGGVLLMYTHDPADIRGWGRHWALDDREVQLRLSFLEVSKDGVPPTPTPLELYV